MPYITAPPGCRQLAFADGGKPVRVDRRGRAYVSDERARMINSMRGNGEGGLINGLAGEFGVRGKAGRWCAACRRLWYPWAVLCPKCDAETVPET
jgi:hypothetical protein